MATGQLSPVIHYLRRLSMPGSAAGLADSQLLERFVYHGEETAFRALVQRHGPAVFRVCRRVLPDPNDADDAFQATFLLLVQKASSLRQPDLLGPAYDLLQRLNLIALLGDKQF